MTFVKLLTWLSERATNCIRKLLASVTSRLKFLSVATVNSDASAIGYRIHRTKTADCSSSDR